MTRTLAGRIVTPDGVVEGVLRITDDGRIAAIEGTPVDPQWALRLAR